MTRKRLFWQYIGQVFRSGWLYLSFFMGIVRLIEKWRGISLPIPHSGITGVGIGALFLAQWNAYKRQWQYSDGRLADLSKLLARGQLIKRDFPGYGQLIHNRDAGTEWFRHHVDWQGEVIKFLREKLAPQAEVRFMLDVSTPSVPKEQMGMSPSVYLPPLTKQLQNLAAILDNANSYL